MSTDNIDRFGHCVVCHQNLITKRVVDGKVIEMFLPIHGHTEFLLNNGSRMQVCICTPCKEKTDFEDSIVKNNIMEAVQKGWLLETNLLIANGTWDKEHGQNYLNTMAFRTIDCHSENLAVNVIQERVKELVNGSN